MSDPARSTATARLPVPLVWEYGYAPDTSLAEALSPRERDVLTLLADGLSDKQIGLALGIHWMTARRHVGNIASKLGARNRTHAVRIAFELGLLIPYRPLTAQAAIELAVQYANLAKELLGREVQT